MVAVTLVLASVFPACPEEYHCVGAVRADDKKPEKTPAANPRATLFFHRGVSDSKMTVLPTGTRIQIRAEAGDYAYDFDSKTIAGETLDDIVQQVYENMKTAGWKVEYLGERTGLIAYGCAPVRRAGVLPYKAIEKIGIHYSGDAQPVAPAAQGKVQLLTLDKGKWKPKP